MYIGSATQWSDFTPTRNKTSFHITKLFGTLWLCHYPKISRVIYSFGKELQGFEFQDLLTFYDVTPKPITGGGSNSIIENVHLTTNHY